MIGWLECQPDLVRALLSYSDLTRLNSFSLVLAVALVVLDSTCCYSDQLTLPQMLNCVIKKRLIKIDCESTLFVVVIVNLMEMKIIQGVHDKVAHFKFE